MKLNELISKMLDNYTEIMIYECVGINRTGRRYLIKPHVVDFQFIPSDIWNADIQFIIPYHDRITIDVVKEQEK